MSLTALRAQLAELIDPPRATSGVLATGITPLDAALSGGGIPCGRLTEVYGPPGGGVTTVVRGLVAHTIAARRWVAYVDAGRTLTPRDWTALNDSGLLWIIRPPRAERGAWCADVLLRSGAFGLVILDGAPALTREVTIRLTRLARESDAAFMLVRHQETWRESRGARAHAMPTASAVRLCVRRTASASRSRNTRPVAASRFTITIEKGGPMRSVEVEYAIDVARRLCAHPEVPDRRGVATRNRRGERVEHAGNGKQGEQNPRPRIEGRNRGKREAGSGDLASATSRHPGAVPRDAHSSSPPTLPRKRRCAEAPARRDAFLLAGSDSVRCNWAPPSGTTNAKRRREARPAGR